MNRGVLYVAYGSPAIACVQKSVASLLEHEPDIDYRVITDQKISGLRCAYAQAADKGARDVKTRLPRFVPEDWEQVLYLDADTVVLRPLDRFFQPLERGWQMVMVRDGLADIVVRCRLKNKEEIQYTAQAYEGGELTQFSGGTMAWAICKATSKFFTKWHDEWKRYGYRDQGALVRALAEAPVRMWPLGWMANGSDQLTALEIWHQHGKARRQGAQ